MTVGPQSRLQGGQNRPYGAVSGRAEITAVIVVVMVVVIVVVLVIAVLYWSVSTVINIHTR